MIELPPCRWRGPMASSGRFPCASAKLVTPASGVSARTCLACPFADHKPVELVKMTIAPLRGVGPGTELKALLAAAAISEQDGCGCGSRANQMDEWGAAGCREHRSEIVTWLKGQWQAKGWFDRLKLASKSLVGGLVLSVTDPIGALVDEAIRRAEDKV